MQVPEKTPDQIQIDICYGEAVRGWEELIAAVQKIQSAARKLKSTSRSPDGYAMNKTIWKHKPDLMDAHLANLLKYCQVNNIAPSALPFAPPIVPVPVSVESPDSTFTSSSTNPK